MPSHTTDHQYESKGGVPGDAATLGMDVVGMNLAYFFLWIDF